MGVLMTGGDPMPGDVYDELLNASAAGGYDWCERLECWRCGELFKPFFFGGKNPYRTVVQECPQCGSDVEFRPIDVDPEYQED